MLFLNNGISLVTSKIAKAKTGVQIAAIIFVLSYLALKTLSFLDASQIIMFIDTFNLIWATVFSATIFTVYTGLHYLFINRAVISAFVHNSSDDA